jgi:lipopolysaccharide export system protein LptC
MSPLAASVTLKALRQQWDKVSMYLPIILMGLLALGSYWVLRNTPSVAPSTPALPPKHEPDYIMRDFSVRTFDSQGLFKSQIRGTEARHYPDTDTLEVDQAHIRAYNLAGHLITARGDKLTTNADQSEHLLEGQVNVVRDTAQDQEKRLPRLEYRGEQLRVFTNVDRVESTLPVEMLRDADRITANTLRYDDRERWVDLHGRVRAVLQPKR